MKCLTKQNSWFVRLTTIIALVTILLCAASPSFADSKELHSQGSANFFGKYEEPKPSPTPDPKPEPGILPDNSNNSDNANTPQTSGKNEPAERTSQFPKTGTIIRNLTLPGTLLVGIALLLFIIRNRKKKN